MTTMTESSLFGAQGQDIFASLPQLANVGMAWRECRREVAVYGVLAILAFVALLAITAWIIDWIGGYRLGFWRIFGGILAIIVAWSLVSWVNGVLLVRGARDCAARTRTMR